MRKADWLIGLLIALVVLAGISYFVRTYKSIQNQNPDRPSVEETLNQMGDGEVATLDEEDEFDEGEYGEEGDTSIYEPDEPTIDDLADLNETRAGSDAGTNGTNSGDETNGNDTTPDSYSGGERSGRFLVVAGTFKQEVNAQTQLKKFKRMGYSNAEIGKFNKSTYASLIVDRFTSEAEAKKLARTLKSKGIDSYVHKKR